MRAFRSYATLGALAAAMLASPTLASAQLPNASPAGYAMGGNFTAIARGYEAVAWNPANLAMPGRPFISFGTLAFGGSTGLAPVDLKMLHEFSGRDVDSTVKVDWINQARLAGGQSGRLDGGFTPFAMSVGPVGLQVGTAFYTNLRLSPDSWETILFGNAGNNGGQAKAIDMTGTRVRGAGISTGAVSFALPIPINLTNGLLANEKAAIGITGKYMIGHGVIVAENLGSQVGTDDILLSIPVVVSDTASKGQSGNGAGADIALSWSGGAWRVGALVENVFNSFKWDTTKLAFRPGTATFDTSSTGSGGTDFDQLPYAGAPQVLKDAVTSQAFKQSIRVGAALKLTSGLTLTADMKTQLGDENAIVIGPKSHFGVGAEWRLLPFLPVRGGVASVTDGWQAGAGIGLRLLGYELGISGGIRRRGTANESGFMIGLVGIGR